MYSYHQPGANGGMLHYIAVNGRTGATMGSIPIQQWKLLLTAITTGSFNVTQRQPEGMSIR